jgi:hypothetical protein
VENRISQLEDNCRNSEGPQTIGQILAELLAQYQVRFPEVRITVVETPATA